MPVTLTKKQLNEILVTERAKSRVKNKQSKFMNKTRGIYSGQQNRIAKENGVNSVLPYSLEQLRELVQNALGKPCPYSGVKLSLSNITVDHATPIVHGGSWGIENLTCCSTSANYQKGMMTAHEFKRLMRGAEKVLSAYSLVDFKRRLSTGGKHLNSGGR